MQKPAWALFTLMTLTSVALACTKIPTDAGSVLSFTVNPLPSPSVVVGDTLRDSLGVVRPVTVSAFNFQGDPIASPGARFSTTDRGIRVDSVSGIVVGDSVRTGARIIVKVGSISAPVQIGVSLRPDSAAPLNPRDSLLYSLTDTTVNISNAMGLTLRHGKTADSVVVGYRVSFKLISPAGTIAQLVNDNGAAGTTADTTDASGNATRRIKLNVAQLTSASDSVVVLASASYRGSQIRGSPVRLVLRYRLK